jgi:S1-C subfamily serine protease
LATLLAALGSRAEARDRHDQVFFHQQGWVGIILGNEQGAAGCAVGADLSPRLRIFILQIVPEGKWVIAFDRFDEQGKRIGLARNFQWSMELFVDGRQVHSGVAVVDHTGMALLEPVLSPSALRALSRGKQLELVTSRGRFQYSLNGASNAIAATGRCAKQLMARPAEASNDGYRNTPQGPSLSSGSGVVVSTNGHVLTNNHVVRGCRSIAAGLAGSKMHMATLAASDPNNDLALLRSSIQPSDVPPLRTGVRTGEPIAVYGFPLAGILPSTGNFTLGNVTATAGLRDDTRLLQISAPVQAGNSGGPLLDQNGNVVGIVVGKLNPGRDPRDLPQNVNFAIKSTMVLSFLEAQGLTFPRPELRSPLPAPDLADRAKAFTVFIVCVR